MHDFEHKQSGTAGVYTYNDGSCQMFLGFENKFQNDGLSLAVFTGATNVGKDNAGFLVDLKESYKYDKTGYLSNNIRIRNTFSEGSNTTQVRVSPLTITIPIGKSTSAYVNPHYVGKYNYNTKEWSQGAGVFAGVEQKIGSSSVALEGQRYNIQDWNKNKGNWGINVIYTKTF